MTLMKDSSVYEWIPKGVALYVDKGYQGIEKRKRKYQKVCR
jgi:IS5 family transposase